MTSLFNPTSSRLPPEPAAITAARVRIAADMATAKKAEEERLASLMLVAFRLPRDCTKQHVIKPDRYAVMSKVAILPAVQEWLRECRSLEKITFDHDDGAAILWFSDSDEAVEAKLRWH